MIRRAFAFVSLAVYLILASLVSRIPAAVAKQGAAAAPSVTIVPPVQAP